MALISAVADCGFEAGVCGGVSEARALSPHLGSWMGGALQRVLNGALVAERQQLQMCVLELPCHSDLTLPTLSPRGCAWPSFTRAFGRTLRLGTRLHIWDDVLPWPRPGYACHVRWPSVVPMPAWLWTACSVIVVPLVVEVVVIWC